jgi:hypothetical protein
MGVWVSASDSTLGRPEALGMALPKGMITS